MVTRQNVDFSNVKESGGFNKNRIPAGDYLATITKVEDAKSKSDGVFQYLFSVKVNKHPSRVFPYYCKLQENQLWKLRNLLIAAGMTVPKKKMTLDPSRVVGKTVGISVEDAEYEGKEQSEIAGIFPAAELADGGTVMDDDDEPAEEEVDTVEDLVDEEEEVVEAEVVEDEEEEEEATESGPYDDLDRAGLKAALKKRDASFVARKSQTDDDLRTLLVEDDARKAAAAKKTTKAAPSEVSDDELDELDIDDL